MNPELHVHKAALFLIITAAFGLMIGSIPTVRIGADVGLIPTEVVTFAIVLGIMGIGGFTFWAGGKMIENRERMEEKDKVKNELEEKFRAIFG